MRKVELTTNLHSQPCRSVCAMRIEVWYHDDPWLNGDDVMREAQRWIADARLMTAMYGLPRRGAAY